MGLQIARVAEVLYCFSWLMWYKHMRGNIFPSHAQSKKSVSFPEVQLSDKFILRILFRKDIRLLKFCCHISYYSLVWWIAIPFYSLLSPLFRRLFIYFSCWNIEQINLHSSSLSEIAVILMTRNKLLSAGFYI